MKELIDNIEQWGQDRNLIEGSRAIDQAMKLFSEFGELSDAVGKSRIEQVKDGIGDVFVVLTLMSRQNGDTLHNHINQTGYTAYQCVKTAVTSLAKDLFVVSNQYNGTALVSALDTLRYIAKHYNLTLDECVAHAYDEIKDRKGVMFNGVFIKESDEAYADAVRELAKQR